MSDFTAARNALIRPLTLISGLCALLGAPACSGVPTGESGETDVTGEPTSVSEENFFPSHELPWRGAAENNSNIGMFQGGNAVIYAWDVGLKKECNASRTPCANVVKGLKIYWITATEPTVARMTQVGSSVDSWNRQVCPSNMWASGYRLTTGRSVANGAPRINQLALRCKADPVNGTTLPLLGSSQGALFAETLDCTPGTTSPERYMGEIFMNKAGDGMNASCVRE